MMERSAPLPVRINRQIGATSADGVDALAASGLLSATRIRTLRLLGKTADVLEVLNHLCSPSPLEALSLFVISTAEPVDLPEALCERDMPHFRRLTFETGAHIRAPLWLLASVTHFTTSAGVSLQELLGTLQAMPRLEVLRVEYILSKWDSIDTSGQFPLARAMLPHLSLLAVRENASPHRLVVLSSFIDAPPTLHRHLFWRVFLMYRYGWEPEIFTAVQALVPQDSARGMDDGGLRSAQVSGGLAHGSFEAWSRTDTDTDAFTREDALFLFRLDWERVLIPPIIAPDAESPGPLDDSCPFFHLASLCAGLQTTRIEDLTVAPEIWSATESETAHLPCQRTPDVRAQWLALLAALPSVKTLRLHRGSPACVSVLRALAASPGLLPHLQKVFVVQSTVRYAAGSAARGSGVGVADAEPEAAYAMAGHKFVQENVGAGLVEAVSVRSGLEIVLVGCEVDEEALKALRKRARVDFLNEWEYPQSVHDVTLE